MAEEYNQAPSSVDATGSMIQARFDSFTVSQNGNLSTGTLLACVVPARCRVLTVFAFRATAGAGGGAGGSTDIDVNVRPLGGVDASILQANALEFEQSAGNALSLLATPDESLPAWDGEGLVVEAQSVISVVVDAIETGATPPTGLVVTIKVQYC